MGRSRTRTRTRTRAGKGGRRRARVWTWIDRAEGAALMRGLSDALSGLAEQSARVSESLTKLEAALEGDRILTPEEPGPLQAGLGNPGPPN